MYRGNLTRGIASNSARRRHRRLRQPNLPRCPVSPSPVLHHRPRLPLSHFRSARNLPPEVQLPLPQRLVLAGYLVHPAALVLRTTNQRQEGEGCLADLELSHQRLRRRVEDCLGRLRTLPLSHSLGDSLDLSRRHSLRQGDCSALNSPNSNSNPPGCSARPTNNRSNSSNKPVRPPCLGNNRNRNSSSNNNNKRLAVCSAVNRRTNLSRGCNWEDRPTPRARLKAV